MTKSLVHSLEGYVINVFKDIKWTYCSVRDWERDRNRSLHELAVRGERLLTIDLPAIRKHFEKCLEDGLYVPTGLYLSAPVSKTVVVPAYLRDLYLQVFHPDGKLRDDPSVEAINDIRQWCEGFGKLKHPCKQEVVDEEIRNFFTIENETRHYSLNWHLDELYPSGGGDAAVAFSDLSSVKDDGQLSFVAREDVINLSRHDISKLQAVCDIISTQFGDFHDERPNELPKHGTGRVSNLAKEESKFRFDHWPAKLDHIFPYDRYATPDYGAQAYLEPTGKVYLNVEAPSKLIAVPKTMSGPRLIASEPNYHQWIQQLVRNQIENRIRTTALVHSISFGDQGPNRVRALSSSHDGALCTVDLKNASDRLSCWTIERAFRANKTLLERIHASRTRMMVNRVNGKTFGTIVLRKCFTQGNGCTFPVQTLLYAMVCIAADLITEGKSVTSKRIISSAKRVRVFGDDIIVPTETLPKLLEILEFLQLKVNLNKTFHKGKFRESCGLDAYNGVEVTPARIKRFSSNPSHQVAQSMLESANNLFRRGMWNTASWLSSHIRSLELPIVAIDDSHGHVSFCGPKYDHLRRRYNTKLHRYERKYHSLTSKSKVVPTESAHDLMQYLHKNANRKADRLAHLAPNVGNSIGVVYKESSVMNSRWREEPSIS